MVLPARGSLPPLSTARDEEGVAEVIAKFKEKDPGLADVFASAAGYAVYPTIGKGRHRPRRRARERLGVRGRARHRPLDHEPGDDRVPVRRPGLQRGRVLQDPAALDNFKLGHLKLDAQASAIALTARASADLAYRNGVAIVTMAKGGLMYEASVGGQKFSFTPIGK